MSLDSFLYDYDVFVSCVCAVLYQIGFICGPNERVLLSSALDFICPWYCSPTATVRLELLWAHIPSAKKLRRWWTIHPRLFWLSREKCRPRTTSYGLKMHSIAGVTLLRHRQRAAKQLLVRQGETSKFEMLPKNRKSWIASEADYDVPAWTGLVQIPRDVHRDHLGWLTRSTAHRLTYILVRLRSGAKICNHEVLRIL